MKSAFILFNLFCVCLFAQTGTIKVKKPDTNAVVVVEKKIPYVTIGNCRDTCVISFDSLAKFDKIMIHDPYPKMKIIKYSVYVIGERSMKILKSYNNGELPKDLEQQLANSGFYKGMLKFQVYTEYINRAKKRYDIVLLIK